ncbi:MAG: 50S ribosomal protein L18 [Bdellovibrionales bacterium]|nr:50S ribosomal protein L18 [Bdellovibrionales bacterium]
MATKIGKKTSNKQKIRFKHKKRIRSKIFGSAERPRLVVFRSNANLYAQLVDDAKAHTLAAASTTEKDLIKSCANIEGAKQVGQLIAKRAQAKGVKTVVFDRGGYLYHGKIKALADAAREAGLQF